MPQKYKVKKFGFRGSPPPLVNALFRIILLYPIISKIISDIIGNLIKNITEVNPFLYLQISGEINSPGIFPFSSEVSLKDLIFKAGGFKFPETIHSIEVVRKEKLGESNFGIISISSSDKPVPGESGSYGWHVMSQIVWL